MVIFTSYVKLPEGTKQGSFASWTPSHDERKGPVSIKARAKSWVQPAGAGLQRNPLVASVINGRWIFF